MATVLAFAGSNSSTSINYQLVQYTAQLIDSHTVNTLDMAHYPFPMYSSDLEKEQGYANAMVELKNDMASADALIISVSEHNSGPSAFFKNMLDWLSRVDRNFLANKKVFLMSTSPGKRGGISALETIESLLPRFGATIVSTFSLPSFSENFSSGITNYALKAQHEDALNKFLQTF